MLSENKLDERLLSKPPYYFFPAIHYSPESAWELIKAFRHLNPDCVAVELPQAFAQEIGTAISRLPDLTFIEILREHERVALHIEPCDPFIEAIRLAQENNLPAELIDLDVERYPRFYDPMPDTYAIPCIGLKNYWTAIEQSQTSAPPTSLIDERRELFMAKELKKLSFSYERILVVTGLRHTQKVAWHVDKNQFQTTAPASHITADLKTYTEDCSREIMSTCGYITHAYEKARKGNHEIFDRHSLHLELLKDAQKQYEKVRNYTIPPTRLATILQFARNLAIQNNKLLPDLFQLLVASRGCVDHRYAFEVWKLATDYTHLKNVDNLQEIEIDPQTLWGSQSFIKFKITTPSGKEHPTERLKKDQTKKKYFSITPEGICSYPPEDKVVEHIGDRLKKRALLIAHDESSSSIPFTTSLEEGIDIRETIRHFLDKSIYVKKVRGRQGQSASCVLIFQSEKRTETGFPWTMSWLGEHEQESDMAFYASNPLSNVVGPGIAQAEYGGFMLISPPRRLFDVWNDQDYIEFDYKEEVLLAAAIDYATKPLIVYASNSPPSHSLKARAQRQGKQIQFIPITTLSHYELQKLRRFHVLDSHKTRKIASDFIF